MKTLRRTTLGAWYLVFLLAPLSLSALATPRVEPVIGRTAHAHAAALADWLNRVADTRSAPVLPAAKREFWTTVRGSENPWNVWTTAIGRRGVIFQDAFPASNLHGSPMKLAADRSLDETAGRDRLRLAIARSQVDAGDLHRRPRHGWKDRRTGRPRPGLPRHRKGPGEGG